MTRCDRCGRDLPPGVSAWARDWTVFDDAGQMARTEIRYTCEECEESPVTAQVHVHVSDLTVCTLPPSDGYTCGHAEMVVPRDARDWGDAPRR